MYVGYILFLPTTSSSVSGSIHGGGEKHWASPNQLVADEVNACAGGSASSRQKGRHICAT